MGLPEVLFLSHSGDCNWGTKKEKKRKKRKGFTHQKGGLVFLDFLGG